MKIPASTFSESLMVPLISSIISKKNFYCFVVNGFCHENLYSESSGTQVRISLTWEFNYSDYYSRSGGGSSERIWDPLDSH